MSLQGTLQQYNVQESNEAALKQSPNKASHKPRKKTTPLIVKGASSHTMEAVQQRC